MKLLLDFRMVEAIRIFFLRFFCIFSPNNDAGRSLPAHNYWD